MDYLHSCYTAPARLISGSDETFTIRWYKAQPGARVYDKPNAFASSVWDDSVTLGENSGLGELRQGHVWSPNRESPFDGKCDVANPDFLSTGIPQSVYDSGSPAKLCCNTLVACDRATIAFNGEGKAATIRRGSGLFAFAGTFATARGIFTACNPGHLMPASIPTTISYPSGGSCAYLDDGINSCDYIGAGKWEIQIGSPSPGRAASILECTGTPGGWDVFESGLVWNLFFDPPTFTVVSEVPFHLIVHTRTSGGVCTAGILVDIDVHE